MGMIESLFDLTYLFLVIFLGVRLMMEGKKEPLLFGSMAVILGIGDAFHLFPRVLSHLSPGGFDAHVKALSYGKLVTGITMTIFYVLYYYYYRAKSGDRARFKEGSVYALALLRIILLLLPGNNRGTANESYFYGILRNIPFLIMGLLLVYWSYKERKKDGLASMGVLIFLSFAFYLPVVLFSDTFPSVGALMIPKTLCYLLIAVLIYKHYIKSFTLPGILGLSASFLVMGLIGGVLYREFTKFYGYEAPNHLGKVHVHTLTLGFLLLMILYLLIKTSAEKDILSFKKPLYLYLSGLIFTIVNMVTQGFLDIVGGDKSHIGIRAFDGMSGLGHILLAVGLVFLMARLYSSVSSRKSEKI